MKVVIYHSRKPSPLSAKDVRRLCTLLGEAYQVQSHTLIVQFVGKRRIQALHEQFFGDPTPTDCISFPLTHPATQDPAHTNLGSAPPSILGEVFVCPEVAAEYAHAHAVTVRSELLRYLVHGFLHLIGFDDTEPAKKRVMRREEERWVAMLPCTSQ